MINQPEIPFRDGVTFEWIRDGVRLNEQHKRVLGVVRDGAWHTLAEISMRTGDPEASISARLRDFRKTKFGGHKVEGRYVEKGLWEYRFIEAVPEQPWLFQ